MAQLTDFVKQMLFLPSLKIFVVVVKVTPDLPCDAYSPLGLRSSLCWDVADAHLCKL